LHIIGHHLQLCLRYLGGIKIFHNSHKGRDTKRTHGDDGHTTFNIFAQILQITCGKLNGSKERNARISCVPLYPEEYRGADNSLARPD